MIDGHAAFDLRRIEGIVKSAVPGLPVYCGGGVPNSATIEDARRCVLLSQSGTGEARIEVRADTCERAESVADDILAVLELAGLLRAVSASYGAPGLSLDFGAHVVVVAVCRVLTAYAAIDKPLRDVPERRCSCCGNTFRPTLKRRMLCATCFTFDGPRTTTGIAPEHRRDHHRSPRAG